MRRRVLTWLVASVLIVAGVLLWWRSSDRPTVANNNSSEVAAVAPAAVRPPRVATTNESTVSESTAPALLAAKDSATAVAAKTNHLAYRLTNTSKSVKQMLRDDRAIHLENALIDTSRPLGFKLPEQLRIVGDPGSYIIQSRGPVDAAFRAALADAGATLISYLPNNAWLVRASAAVAQKLAANPETQAVLPWEPVYKLKAELLELAMQQEALPPDAKLNLLVYSGERATVIAQLQKLEAVTVAETTSPFGSVITVRPGADWVALARLPGVQIMERAYPRALANDLSRVRIGVATNTVTTTNYLGLTGTNILISLNDFGVDVNHPDFAGNRLFGTSAAALVDTDGHGTHVAGILIGSGVASTNVTNARGSLNPGTNGQYRGVAPGAKLFVQRIYEGLNSTPDETLQQNIARTNALISNNSWSYSGDSSYSLAAASYDAAVRDSLPGVTGSQPVLYVFAAGNSGGGSDAGLSGNPGSVLSPGTAKNVVTVGAIELERDITNVVEKIVGSSTNKTTPWKAMTSSGNQVARFSSRGNVGIGVEGDFGRFKPDVMAPGTFVISTRSTTWDEAAYYNPTNHSYTRLRNQLVATNGSLKRSIFLPDNAVGFSITLLGNDDSPIPFPNLPIYVRRNGQASASTYDLRRTNSVSVPPDLGGVGTFVGQNWSYSIGNPTGAAVNFDIFTDVITTNDLGNYYQVLSNLNNSISSTNLTTPNLYRYESGTSMAAPAVAGTLALMQEFFEQRLRVTNSPALMKALLINGARSVGNLYDFQVQNSVNFQGWGLIKLNNSLPAGISNAFKYDSASGGAIKLFDQSPTNALATGQSVTRFITVDEAGQTLPLRVTLAWTDPPGNPAAGVKLVNDLDLVITNIETGDIYYGNDIPGSSTLTFPWDTNAAPNLDSVNNVENIFLSPVLGTNYSITVIARRVNVNAVTAHTNDVVQDYALVISCGSGEATNALTVGPQATFTATERTPIAYVTNTFSVPNDFSATFLQNQHVGANSPLLGTTNGVTNQWRFYVVTNTTSFTNAAFLISQQTDLATPRLGVFATSPGESTRRYADLDLYVSKDAGLTNLDPAVVAASFKSLSRNDLSGDELILFTNSVLNDVYYVGVKSEDQQAAEYEFFGIFSLLPLGSEDANGFVRAYPMSGYLIPDGSPSQPGGARFFAVTRPAIGGGLETIRRVVVTNNVGHENYGDVISTVDHNSRAVVLDNHRSLETPPYLAPPGPYSFLYDDSGEGDFLNAIPPDGPGTFETFIGEAPGGTWYFTYSDDALSQAGGVTNVMIRLDRQPDDDRIITNTVAVNSWRYFSRNVPVEATNLTVIISNLTASTPGPLELYIRKGARPTRTVYDYSKTINPPGDSLSVDKSNIPPLTGGRYFIGIYNGNATAQTFTYQTIVLLGAAPTPTLVNGVGSQPLLDDAGTNYSITVTNTGIIGQLDVGLRIDHPRVSDLAVTLVSPRGTRVLLVENRGGTNVNGFGSSLSITNFTPVAANGGAAGQTNFIDTQTTAGTVTIDYDFFDVPDQMTVYYQGTLLADTGMTSGANRFTLSYGPGASTFVEVRMNEFGNTNSGTAWNYSVSSYNTANSYLVFTDNTNKTTTPIKFAVPPFSGTLGISANISDFEPPVVVQNYVAPATPDGWGVLSNTVTVVTNTANTGVQSLALRSGQIQRTLSTVPGRAYRLGYAYRKASLDGMVAWWQLEGNANDRVGANNGSLVGGPAFTTGEVGSAMTFDGGDDHIFVPGSPSLNVGVGGGLTIESWIKPVSVAGQQPLVEWNNGASIQSHFWISVPALTGGPGSLWANLVDTANVPHAISSAPGIVIANTYQHVAMTYDKISGLCTLYLNGNVVAQTNLGIFTPDTSPNLYLGYRPSGVAAGARFNGDMDEVSIYGRALSGGEIASIYNAGTAGKCGMPIPPNICATPLGAQIFVLGLATNSFLGNANWQLGGLFFTATNTNTLVTLSPINSNAPSGVLVDSFTLTESSSPRYVLPEESLKAFEGESAFGTWQLEILDTRTGASNNVSLVDWQLQFTFQTAVALPTTLQSGVPKTETIRPGGIIYYIVDVPPWARFATNMLLGATGPLNLYFNQYISPTGTNLVPLDYTLLANVTSGSQTLTTNVPPPVGLPVLLPGQRYYLAVENPSTTTNVTFTLQVEFDLAVFPDFVSLTNGVPYCTFNAGPTVSLDYYRYTVSSNSLRAQFELNNLSGDVTLLLRRGLPPTFGVLDYFSANVFTNDEVITVFNFSQPVSLTPGEWYMAAGNISGGPVSYCAKVTEWPVYGTNIVITNTFLGASSFCLTWTSLPEIHYLVEGITNILSTNWVTVSPTITATGYTTTHCVPLPSPFQFFRVREGVTLSTYFPPPKISRIRRVFSGIEITWGGPTNVQYQVQWTPTLVPTNWTAFTNPPAVTSTSGVFQFLDNGSETGGTGGIRFYRLLQLP